MVSSLISPGPSSGPKSAQKCLLNKRMNETCHLIPLALSPESSLKTALALSHRLTRSANGVIADNHKAPTSEPAGAAAKGFRLPPPPTFSGSPSKLMLVKETSFQVRGMYVWFVFVAWKLLTSRDILLPALAHEKLMTFFLCQQIRSLFTLTGKGWEACSPLRSCLLSFKLLSLLYLEAGVGLETAGPVECGCV